MRGEKRKKLSARLEKQRTIFLYARISGLLKPVKCTTSWKCSQLDWTGDNANVKVDPVTHGRISNLVEWFEESIKAKAGVTLSKHVIENKIDEINGRPERNKLLSEFVPWVENFIDREPVSKGTKANYKQALLHLQSFAKRKNI